MKHNKIHVLIAFVIMLCAAIPALYADEICDVSVNEGIQEYYAGNYQKAKELFEYAKSECGSTYGDAQSWIDKCKEALTPTTLSVYPTSLSFDANGGSETITVSCNCEWSYTNTSSSAFSITRNGNSLTISCNANTITSSRSGSFYVNSTDGEKSVTISISQQGRQSSSQNNNRNNTQTNSSNSSSRSTSNSETNIILSKTSASYFSNGTIGTEELIQVTCNGDWHLEDCFKEDFFFVYRKDQTNNIRVCVYENTTSSDREGCFYVVCGNQKVKVSLSQTGKNSNYSNSSSYSSSSYNSSYRSNYSSGYTRKSAYKKYIEWSGLWEVTWIGVSAGIGYGFNITGSTLRCRFGPVEVRPIDIAIVDYKINTGLNISYQPIVDFYIPVSSDKAIYFGAGPSIGLLENNLWFRTEVGFHWNWGGTHASSDFFARYDGALLVGVSIQCSSHW